MHHFVALPQADAPSNSGVDLQHTTAIKAWTRDYLKLPETSVVLVNEFACRDPGCPLLETIIVVFEAEQSRTWTLTRPRVAVTKMMVQQTLSTRPEIKLKE